MLFKTFSIFFFTLLASAKRFPFIWPTPESYLKLLTAFKQFQQLISLTEKTSRTLFVLYYQPS
jgi:hypothetical protein